jgi:heat shock protein HtpX
MNNQLKTLLLLGVLSAIVISLGGMMGRGYLFTFTIITVLMNVGAYFYSDKMVLTMNRAQEVSERDAPALHRIVSDLALRAGIPKPRVYVVPSDQPNAFATGRSPEHAAVAVNQGIMRILSERELEGVLAHELAHVKNRDILISTIAATLAAVISSLANALQWGLIFGGGRSGDRDSRGEGILVALFAPLAATLIQLAVSRSREFQADATGAKICGDPQALASALGKLERGAHAIPASVQPATASHFIVNPFAGMRGLGNLFSTHPPIEERIRRLLAMSGSGAALSG